MTTSNSNVIVIALAVAMMTAVLCAAESLQLTGPGLVAVDAATPGLSDIKPADTLSITDADCVAVTGVAIRGRLSVQLRGGGAASPAACVAQPAALVLDNVSVTESAATSTFALHGGSALLQSVDTTGGMAFDGAGGRVEITASTFAGPVTVGGSPNMTGVRFDGCSLRGGATAQLPEDTLVVVNSTLQGTHGAPALRVTERAVQTAPPLAVIVADTTLERLGRSRTGSAALIDCDTASTEVSPQLIAFANVTAIGASGPALRAQVAVESPSATLVILHELHGDDAGLDVAAHAVAITDSSVGGEVKLTGMSSLCGNSCAIAAALASQPQAVTSVARHVAQQREHAVAQLRGLFEPPVGDVSALTPVNIDGLTFIPGGSQYKVQHLTLEGVAARGPYASIRLHRVSLPVTAGRLAAALLEFVRCNVSDGAALVMRSVNVSLFNRNAENAGIGFYGTHFTGGARWDASGSTWRYSNVNGYAPFLVFDADCVVHDATIVLESISASTSTVSRVVPRILRATPASPTNWRRVSVCMQRVAFASEAVQLAGSSVAVHDSDIGQLEVSLFAPVHTHGQPQALSITRTTCGSIAVHGVAGGGVQFVGATLLMDDVALSAHLRDRGAPLLLVAGITLGNETSLVLRGVRGSIADAIDGTTAVRFAGLATDADTAAVILEGCAFRLGAVMTRKQPNTAVVEFDTASVSSAGSVVVSAGSSLIADVADAAAFAIRPSSASGDDAKPHRRFRCVLSDAEFVGPVDLRCATVHVDNTTASAIDVSFAESGGLRSSEAHPVFSLMNCTVTERVTLHGLNVTGQPALPASGETSAAAVVVIMGTDLRSPLPPGVLASGEPAARVGLYDTRIVAPVALVIADTVISVPRQDAGCLGIDIGSTVALEGANVTIVNTSVTLEESSGTTADAALRVQAAFERGATAAAAFAVLHLSDVKLVPPNARTAALLLEPPRYAASVNVALTAIVVRSGGVTITNVGTVVVSGASLGGPTTVRGASTDVAVRWPVGVFVADVTLEGPHALLRVADTAIRHASAGIGIRGLRVLRPSGDMPAAIEVTNTTINASAAPAFIVVEDAQLGFAPFAAPALFVHNTNARLASTATVPEAVHVIRNATVTVQYPATSQAALTMPAPRGTVTAVIDLAFEVEPGASPLRAVSFERLPSRSAGNISEPGTACVSRATFRRPPGTRIDLIAPATMHPPLLELSRIAAAALLEMAVLGPDPPYAATAAATSDDADCAANAAVTSAVQAAQASWEVVDRLVLTDLALAVTALRHRSRAEAAQPSTVAMTAPYADSCPAFVPATMAPVTSTPGGRSPSATIERGDPSRPTDSASRSTEQSVWIRDSRSASPLSLSRDAEGPSTSLHSPSSTLRSVTATKAEATRVVGTSGTRSPSLTPPRGTAAALSPTDTQRPVVDNVAPGVAVTAVVIAAAVGSGGLSPGTAARATRVGALRQLGRCTYLPRTPRARLMEVDVSFAELPVQFPLPIGSDEELRDHLAMPTGAAVASAALAAVSAAIPTAVFLRGRHVLEGTAVSSAVRFASVAAIVLPAYLSPGVVEVTLAVAVDSVALDASGVAVAHFAALAFAVLAVVPLAVSAVVAPRYVVPRSADDDGGAGALVNRDRTQVTFPGSDNAPCNSADDAATTAVRAQPPLTPNSDPAPQRPFVECFAPVVESSRVFPGTVWVRVHVGVEAAVAVLLAAIAAVPAVGDTACLWRAVSAVALAALYLLYLAVWRPYRSRLELAFVLSAAIAQLTTAAALAARLTATTDERVVAAENASDHALVAQTVLLLLQPIAVGAHAVARRLRAGKARATLPQYSSDTSDSTAEPLLPAVPSPATPPPSAGADSRALSALGVTPFSSTQAFDTPPAVFHTPGAVTPRSTRAGRGLAESNNPLASLAASRRVTPQMTCVTTPTLAAPRATFGSTEQFVWPPSENEAA